MVDLSKIPGFDEFDEVDQENIKIFTKLFIARYGNILRYIPELDKWLIWDGKKWKIDKKGKEVQKLIISLAEDLHRIGGKFTLTGDDDK